MAEENKKINLAQARQILKYLDNIGYMPLSMHAELDTLIETIIASEDYKKARADVEAKAEEFLKEYNEKDSSLSKEIEELNKKFEWAWKKESKKLRQDIWVLEQTKKDEFESAKKQLNEYQNKRMDTEARDIFLAEVSPNLYETLERKFYIADFEWEAPKVESVDTDKLVTEVIK